MKRIIASLVLVLLPLSFAFAVKVSSLYEADILVPAQTDDLKAQAIQDGLLQVLMKLSCKADIEQNPLIQEGLTRANYYVQDLRYLPSSTSSFQYRLRIRYDASDVQRLLRNSGVLYWEETRPLILVWLAVTTPQNETEIISDEIPDNIFPMMKAISKKYALPLIFPVMDVSDVDQVSSSDIISMSIPLLKDAGKRYAADALLIGHIVENTTGFASNWALILKDTQWKWVIADKSKEVIMVSTLNRVSELLAKNHVAKKEIRPRKWMTLEISLIADHEHLVKLLQYLKQLHSLNQVQLSRYSGDVADVLVLIKSSLQEFKDEVAKSKYLAFKYQTMNESQLGYVWHQQ
jgi:uncharacterized protein